MGGRPEVCRIETTEKAIRRFVKSLGGPEGLAVFYEAGPGGFALWRLLSGMGVACDVIAPSLVPVCAGDRVKTDRRDAKKLVGLFRGGLLRFVQPPTPETEGLRDLLRCRDDIRCARTAARHRVAKQLLRRGRIYRDGKKAWTLQHRAWVLRQRLDDPLAHEALSQMLTLLDSLDRQLATLDAQLERIAGDERWAWQVDKLRAFRGIQTLTALGLIAEIGASHGSAIRGSSRPGWGSRPANTPVPRHRVHFMPPSQTAAAVARVQVSVRHARAAASSGCRRAA